MQTVGIIESQKDFFIRRNLNESKLRLKFAKTAQQLSSEVAQYKKKFLYVVNDMLFFVCLRLIVIVIFFLISKEKYKSETIN